MLKMGMPSLGIVFPLKNRKCLSPILLITFSVKSILPYFKILASLVHLLGISFYNPLPRRDAYSWCRAVFLVCNRTKNFVLASILLALVNWGHWYWESQWKVIVNFFFSSGSSPFPSLLFFKRGTIVGQSWDCGMSPSPSLDSLSSCWGWAL